MSIQYSYDPASKTLQLQLSGRLDFASHQVFSDAYHSQPSSNVTHYTLDMADLTYLDSSALGMLLLLKDYASNDAQISIENCIPEVYRIFEIANFNQLFTIKKSED